MRAVSIESKGKTGDGKEIVEAFVIANTTPDPLPTTGENVTGMTEDQIFAPFSVLYVTGTADTKVYIADENGEFAAQ